MLFRGEMSERISAARTVTERKANRTLREKGVRTSYIIAVALTVHQEDTLRIFRGVFFLCVA